MIDENQQIEINLLLQAIFVKYGYDFRNYARASIKRRILRRLSLHRLASISEMQHQVLYDPVFFEQLLVDLSINVTEMYRDPFFFLSLKDRVIPELKELSHLKIWHAGCATGEEVYSLAILLREEGLYDRTLIYATDFNEDVLKKAKEGIYPAKDIDVWDQNYRKSQGKALLSDYFTNRYGYVSIKSRLKKNIVFADHNLTTDSSFGEMNMILCRNVLIYFNRELQNRVFRLFYDSLAENGFLCLGTKETVRFSDFQDRFREIDVKAKIYQKA